MNINKMITEILGERILNDGLSAKGWKQYNDGITKAVQVIREYEANALKTSTESAKACDCMKFPRPLIIKDGNIFCTKCNEFI